ncbi:hypothetical protein SAMN06272759_106174 [Novosphingobium sp. B1]|nr:hypothetical protein SAMN06272759_106174 [Novosphingobium sp. B1]
MLLLGILAGGLGLIWHFGSAEVAIDTCLDAGGSWDYAAQNCQEK